ncbi:TonB C terminal [Enhydrobacter aerosaccus]|uniref:TonB C terminal n=1 Tax=Enhydrobacter aerosaccus TaxID=225324 RepID=A0A1T4T0R7_9HYPH|nr:energy transducer TonB [Enhydrobacter aerosaccus]SKA34065.1 TonB C terminal [Enhydrobacter aerosaccus]
MPFPETTSFLLFNRMSPAAATLSAMVHAAVAAAFLSGWSRADRVHVDTPPIEVIVEHPTLPTAERTQLSVPSAVVPATSDANQTSDPDVPPTVDAQGESSAPSVSEATLEQALPPLQAPPPPIEARDFAALVPSRPASPRSPPPLSKPMSASSRAVRQQPAVSQAPAVQGGNQRKAEEDYLWQIIRKLSQYRFREKTRQAGENGLVVARLTLARDGRVLDAALAQSSGFADLDRGVVETIRRASPFAPLPADIPDDRHTFIVPLSYSQDQE